MLLKDHVLIFYRGWQGDEIGAGGGDGGCGSGSGRRGGGGERGE